MAVIIPPGTPGFHFNSAGGLDPIQITKKPQPIKPMMNVEQYLYTCGGEEGAEIAQRGAKAVRFGGKEMQPGLGTNSTRFYGEFIDLVAVVELMVENGLIEVPSRDVIEKMKAAKKDKIIKYFEYSRERGTVDGALIVKRGEARPDPLKLAQDLKADFEEFIKILDTSKHRVAPAAFYGMRTLEPDEKIAAFDKWFKTHDGLSGDLEFIDQNWLGLTVAQLHRGEKGHGFDGPIYRKIE